MNFWRGRVLVAIVVAAIWGLITHGTFAGSGDEPHYMMIAHSIAFDGDLDLANQYRDATLIGGGKVLPELHVRMQGQKMLPVHDIGWPVLISPVFRGAYTAAGYLAARLPPSLMKSAKLNDELLLRHQLSLIVALIAGLLAREVFLFLMALSVPARAAFGWALLFALSPPILSHAFLFFTEIPSAFIAMAVFRRLVYGRPRDASTLLLGLAAGFLVLVHARNIGLVAGLTVVAALMLRQIEDRRRVFLMFAIGLAAALAVRTAVTYVLWGTFVTTPHAALAAVTSPVEIAREVFNRARGLLFDREYGLLTYAPIYLLAAPGLILFARTQIRRLALAFVLVTLGYVIPVLLPVTNIHGWNGGWSPAARFLVPIVAFLWIPLAVLGVQARGGVRVFVLVLVLVQIALDAFLWQFPRTLWNDGDGISALPAANWIPGWVSAAAFLLILLYYGAAQRLATLGERGAR